MQLKFEKVYMGCVLMSKKRYVGLKYESEKQEKGEFDAKGIETIRRDSCPIVAKMMKKVLGMLFTTVNGPRRNSPLLPEIKKYLLRQWTKLLAGTVRPRDCIFAKEVRLGSYRNTTTLPPAAVVSTHAIALDRRATPRYAERIEYVVINGPPGAPLTQLVVSPHSFLQLHHGYILNGHYYITKQVRCLETHYVFFCN